MKGWVLTTCVKRPPDPYTECILPLTGPLFRDYAADWGLAFDPHIVTEDDVAEFKGVIRTRGTEAVYGSWLHRRVLLDEYEGVVYMDEDCVILNPGRDLCLEVTDEKPFGFIDGLCTAVMVMKSCDKTRELMDLTWDMRHEFKHYQWCEEGAIKKLMGWDWIYENNTAGAAYLGPTEWTPYLNLMQWVMTHPLDPDAPLGPWMISTPGGVHPFSRRLQLVTELAERAGRLRDALCNARQAGAT